MVLARLLSCFVSLLLLGPLPLSAQGSQPHKALRLDFLVGGDQTHEEVFLVELRQEPIWAGPLKHPIYPDFGVYAVEIRSPEGQVRHRQGVSSLFREWQTTPEARSTQRAFAHSLVMPWPQSPCSLHLLVRDARGNWQEKASWPFEPTDHRVRRDPVPRHPLIVLQETGPLAERVDLLFLAEGYRPEERALFEKEARALCASLWSTPPFDTLQKAFNVRALFVPSHDSGPDEPSQGRFRATAFNSTYDTFDIDRYLTTFDTFALRNAAAQAPCDHLVLLVNSRRYGGGGFYNHLTLTTTRSSLSEKVFAHELGHGLAGLGDEYYTSAVSYENFYPAGVEPWEPNLTTLTRFETKWKDMVPAGRPIPTPREPPFAQSIGVYEGGGYSSRGVFSPFQDCRMKSNEAEGFCPVCQRAITRMVAFLSDREAYPQSPGKDGTSEKEAPGPR